jgi:hypothetical protein
MSASEVHIPNQRTIAPRYTEDVPRTWQTNSATHRLT